MKKILLIIFISYISLIAPLKSDNIQNFQIEGISLGDSLLDFFSVSEIKKNAQKDYFKDNTYSQSEWMEIKSKTYNNLSIAYKTNDKKYKVVHISGVFFINFNECKKKMKVVDEEIQSMFKSFKRTTENRKHEYDKTGDSHGIVITYWAENYDSINISCINWSEKITSENNWHDNLHLSITRKDFLVWQHNVANK